MWMKRKLQWIILYALVLIFVYILYVRGPTQRKDDELDWTEFEMRQIKHFDDSFPPDLPANLSAYNPRMISVEKEMLLDIMETFDKKMTEASLTYHLYGGSLLGLYRHGGIIPWDDDIDVWINNSQSALFKNKFNDLVGFQIFSPENSTWKFYSDAGIDVVGEGYKWPFVDIFRFDENATHTWDTASQYKQLFVYEKKDIYPLKKCKFEKLLLNVPKHLEKIVTTNYAPEICATNKFDHKINKAVQNQRQALPCKNLNEYFKFHKPSCTDIPIQ